MSYPVSNRPEVELVTEPIARLTPTGIFRGFAINGHPNFFMIGGPYAIAYSSYIDRFGDTPNVRPTYHPNVWWDSRSGKIEPHLEMARGRTGRATDPTPVGNGSVPGEPR